jgi:hypothetical protein
MTAEEELKAYEEAHRIRGLEAKVLKIIEQGYNES